MARDILRQKLDSNYSMDFMLVAGLAYTWRKLRPDNDEIKALVVTIADMHTYVQGLQAEVRVLEQLMEETNQKYEL